MTAPDQTSRDKELSELTQSLKGWVPRRRHSRKGTPPQLQEDRQKLFAMQDHIPKLTIRDENHE